MIPTALELIESKFPNHNGVFVLRNIEEFMIEFAKLHVEAALTEASKTTKWKEQITMQGLEISIIKSSILNSYPESNIK